MCNKIKIYIFIHARPWMLLHLPYVFFHKYVAYIFRMLMKLSLNSVPCSYTPISAVSTSMVTLICGPQIPPQHHYDDALCKRLFFPFIFLLLEWEANIENLDEWFPTSFLTTCPSLRPWEVIHEVSGTKRSISSSISQMNTPSPEHQRGQTVDCL